MSVMSWAKGCGLNSQPVAGTIQMPMVCRMTWMPSPMMLPQASTLMAMVIPTIGTKATVKP